MNTENEQQAETQNNVETELNAELLPAAGKEAENTGETENSSGVFPEASEALPSASGSSGEKEELTAIPIPTGTPVQLLRKEEPEETERLKAFRERKKRELARRKRNAGLLRAALALGSVLLIAAILYGGIRTAASGGFTVFRRRFVWDEKDAVYLTEEATTEAAEETTEEVPVTEEPTTEAIPETTEAPTAAPDPREDVWTHYANLFMVNGTDTYLNVRDQPGQSGNIIGKLVKYAGGELLEDLGNGWFHIRSGGIEGYCAAEFCCTGEAAKELALWHCFDMVEITAERLNVRSGPGVEYEVWTQLSSQERQVVEEEIGDWYKISFNSTYGYINKEFTKKSFFVMEAMPWSSISKYSEARQRLFAYAEQFIGTPYVYGGTSLTSGIDCSSYVQQCFMNVFGMNLNRTTREQIHHGAAITMNEAKAGDLLFYRDANGVVNHVAIYMGDGKILHAAQSFGRIVVSSYNYATNPTDVRNVIGD